jgi:hypothetical protein
MGDPNYKQDKHYQYLLGIFGDRIQERFESLWEEAVKIIEGWKLDTKVVIDEESFQMAIIDYFSDVVRIKDFHSIKKTNVDKIYGYQMYWLLRRKPIQIVVPTKDNFDINEKVIIGIFFPKILAEAKIPYGKDTKNKKLKDRLSFFVNLLFYNLKYRVYTPQSLELMIEAFLCGHSISSFNS